MDNNKNRTDLSEWFDGNFGSEWQSPDILPDLLKSNKKIEPEKLWRMKFQIQLFSVELLMATGKVENDLLPIKALLIPLVNSFLPIGVRLELFCNESSIYQKKSKHGAKELGLPKFKVKRGDRIQLKIFYLGFDRKIDFEY